MLDNGSRDSNYVSEKVAEELRGARYGQDLKVVTGDGKVTPLKEFTCLLIKIKVRDEIKFSEHLKFFIFPNLPINFVIGRATLVKYGLYSLMEIIDRDDLERKTNGAKGRVDKEELTKMEAELDSLAPAMADWGESSKEKENAEFQEYMRVKREEINTMLDESFGDVFSTKPPKQPAKVWEQKLNLVGEPIDTPEGLRKAPAELKGNGRRLPPRYLEAARKQINELVEQGVLEPSTSPISVPLLLTPKPNTDPLEMRLCLDCKKVNTLILRENFPMGGMNEFIGWMEDVQPEFFIKLDLTQMYFQLPLEMRSRLLMAFVFGYDKWQFTRVVMGTANSVGHAQNVMVNQVLVGLMLKTAFSYLDDIIIPGNRTTHDIGKALVEVLLRFRERGLYLKRAKCEIMVSETIFLGHKISREGVEISPKKRVDFNAAPRPVTTTNLRSFLALANYFRKYLPNYAEVAAPLYKLTGGPKQRRIEWTEDRELAFKEIKRMVQEAVPLRWMTREGRTEVYCDASKFGFGGGIFQDQGEDFEGKQILTAIAFWSGAFTDYQVKWHTSDREMFSMCYGIMMYHHLLAGRPFTVFTDHSALVSMRESVSERINRMKEKLAIYDMTLADIAGKRNCIGDGLSRIFINEEDHEPPEGDEEVERVIEAYSNQSLVLMTEEDSTYLPWLRHYHGERGHWPLEKTMGIVRQERAEWPDCERMLQDYIANCEVCTANEPRRQRYHGRRYSLSGDRPGVAWAIDLKEVGEGYEGHKYILVIIDEFSRRVTLFPLRGKSAEEATYYVWHHILDSGRPERVRYDPGREFNNDILKGILEFLQAQDIQTGAGDHRGNGIVERFMAELDGQLRRYYQSRPPRTATDWIWFLPVIAKNHNEIRHSTTGMAPNELHGERFWGLEEDERDRLISHVRDAIVKAKPRRVDRANAEALQVGVRVYVAVETKEKRNLEGVNWEGPFTIIRRRGDLVEVRERQGYEYHVSRLKLAVKK